MEDKDDVKRNRKSLWLWIVGILVIAGIVWWIVADGEEQVIAYDAPETGQVQETVGGSASAVLRAYVQFAEEMPAKPDFNMNHDYINEGILKLQNALQVLVREKTDLGAELQDEMEALESTANELQKNPESLRHAELTQQAFVRSARILQLVQEDGEEDLVNKVMAAANDIKAQVPTLDQKTEILQFFRISAQAIAQMSDEVESEEGPASL
ncbi:hypothetical protein ACFSRY_15155 [Pontibacter locisalis]|uniref:Uncharacterized protein n=1 Tax=Pontibacter locisalis TaxID=1719035 RepID=A0ABW5IT79_9BACT